VPQTAPLYPPLNRNRVLGGKLAYACLTWIAVYSSLTHKKLDKVATQLTRFVCIDKYVCSVSITVGYLM